MSFNTFIQACRGFLTGRYIGAGRDTSGPTGCRVRSPYPCYFVQVHHCAPTFHAACIVRRKPLAGVAQLRVSLFFPEAPHAQDVPDADLEREPAPRQQALRGIVPG